MSEPGTPGSPDVPRGRRVPAWVLAVVVTVAITLTAAITYAATRPGPAPEPTASPAPSQTPTAPPQAQAPGAPVGGYKIEAGAGGTAIAVDGRTPIGYPAQCEGAVAAATNYYTAVNTGLDSEETTSEQFDALLSQINAGLDPGDGTGKMSALKEQFATSRAEAVTSGIPVYPVSYHPEWGVFLVQSCIDENTAVVDIAGAVEWGGAPGFSLPAASRLTLSWFNDDWRLVDFQGLEDAPTIPTDAPAPLPAELRKAMIAEGGPGWTEFTNAP